MTARARGRTLAVGVVLLFAALLAIGIVPRVRRKQELEARTTAANAPPAVTVVTIGTAKPVSDITLPGTVEPMREAALYARSTGYVRRYLADIGTRVRAGQLLAEIETPEIDQELAQARAALGQVRAAQLLAQTSLARWEAMVKDSAATRQELDERRAAYTAASATVAASEANARRLQQLQSFGRVVAPFAGTVTARNVDVGQLVSPSPAARPLFVLAQADTGRVMINVPETAAAQVHAGAEASVTVRGSGTAVTGRVVRSAGALDAATRTMLTEVQVPNASGALLPGMYAQVKLAVRSVGERIMLPANALIVRTAGPQVAVVRDGVVRFVKVELGRDLGTDIEVLSGLAEGATVVVNPTDDVVDGAKVRAVPAAKP